tara:strand:- start:320 stop:532 length:213 start_codon:yes stop_codon:yes gene_type:complete
MVSKKTWNKARSKVIKAGICTMCDKALMSNEGGWIVNANKDYFCESHKANFFSCFDEYLKQLKQWKELNR